MLLVILSFGFLLVMRGTRGLSPQRPVEGLVRIWHEAADLFLTVALILTLEEFAVTAGTPRSVAREYSVLAPGIAAYLLSRYQKKADTFFLAALAIVFTIHACQADLMHGLSLAWAVAMGIAVFQTGLLGLRYRLLFSPVPAAVKGWPVLCLLAAFLALIFGAVAQMVF